VTRSKRSKSNYRGCLLGGAIGDALGAAVEFDSLSQIRARFGPGGLSDFAEVYGREGAITDDTQMTLFTAEALIRADNRKHVMGEASVQEVAVAAYLRWLHTQGEPYGSIMRDRGWLVDQQELHAHRAPGNTCLSALHGAGHSPWEFGTPRIRVNNSKGCGGVMRIPPVGLTRDLDPFQVGCELAAITHGHPSGFFAAGVLAQVIHALSLGDSLDEAIDGCLRGLDNEEMAETRRAVTQAVELARGSEGTPEDVERLGEGWVAEEALAIGIYCALKATDFEHGVLLAVNHGGDSDSTGSITGNILGIVYGLDAIPRRWLQRLELCDVITQVATDLWIHFGEGDKPEWADFEGQGQPPDWERYPGN